MKKRKLLALLGAALLGASVQAQDFKAPIKIVVPFAAGGATDAVARLLAPRLSKESHQQVIIENRPGASGQLGSAAVKAARGLARTQVSSGRLDARSKR